MHSKEVVDIAKLNITTRLLAEEAQRAGYEISCMASRPSTGSYTIRCEKDGREFYFKSLCTALSPSYAVFMAEDKVLTKSVLSRGDIQMPDTVVVQVDNPEHISLDNEARDVLKRHGRLVVKPAKANHGDGVTVDIRSEADLRRALHFAYVEGGYQPDVLIQQMVFGREYRFLVLHNKVLAVAYRRPPFVIGDGTSTIRELIEQKNTDQRRGEGHQAALTKIAIDEVENSNPQGFLEIVPPKSSEVEVLKTSNLSRGGESVDVTDEVSTSLKNIAIRAAHACSLGIAGVDIVTNDISGDGKDSYVLEVNISPGIRMHQFPSVGKSRNVAKTLFNAIRKTAHPVGKKMITIGRVEKVGLPGVVEEKFRARIDTGATVSSLWASDIRTDETGLRCKIFGKGHPLYTGEDVFFSEYSMRSVRSSSGHEELRYQVTMSVTMKGKRVKSRITLADRSGQIYPMLIGRNVLRNKFIVHVADGDIDIQPEKVRRKRTV